MAISQGLQGIKESIGSFKALGAVMAKTALGQKALTAAQVVGAATMKVLNFVMSLNPVFLIVAGITALVAAFKIFSSSTVDVTELNKKLNETFEAQNKALDETIAKTKKLGEQRLESIKSTNELELQRLEQEGASAEEIHAKKLQILKEENEQVLKNLKTDEEARKAQMKQLQGENKAKRMLLNLARKLGKDDLAKEISDEVKANKEKYDTLNAQHGDYNHKKNESDKQYQKQKEALDHQENERIKRENKEKLDRYKAYLADRLKARRAIEDAEFELFRDFEERERQLRKRALEDIESDESLLRNEKEERKRQVEKKFNEEELLRAGEFFELRKVQTLDQERTISDLVIQEHTQRAKKTTQISIEQRKKDLEDRIANQEFALSMASEGFSIMADLANTFAGESEEAQKRAFRINKAAGIAQATIDTYLGAQKAYASQLIPADPSSPLRAAIAAGVAVAGGLARIAAIARTKFEGGGSVSAGGGASGGGGIGGGATSRPAEFNVVGNTGNNQLAQTLGSGTMKAYVVGADVTTQQSLDRNKIDTATL
jgi:hypothetical protein